MYLYRAINDNDLSTLSLNEGLYSKDITESLKEETFYFLLYANRQLDNFLKLPKEEQKSIYKSYIHDFTFDVSELRHLTAITLNKINLNDIQNLTNEQKQNIIKVLSTINTHLVHGSRVNTQWISFTSDIHRTEKYYLSQAKNKVAVIESNVNLIVDGNYMAVDLSSKEIIKKQLEFGFLMSKDFNRCSSNFRGYNNSAKDKEVIYYSHIPQEKIITVLEPIQVDLIYNDLFNEDFYKLNNDTRYRAYEYFKYYIKFLLKDLSDIEEKVLFEHYFNSKSLASLYSDARDVDKFISAKKKILSKIPINKVTSRIMNGKCQNIILPEENRYSK